MAEINEVFRLEFDATGFEQGVQNAIQRLDDLSAASDDAAASISDLESAEDDLSGMLKTQAVGVDNLNSKREVLVRTQQGLNKESKSFTAVGGEVARTNTQIATTTATATTRQRSFFGGLVQGAQRLNSMRRAAGLLGSALRLVSGIGIGTLIASAIPFIIGLFGKLTGAAKDSKSELDKLNDPDTSLESQKRIMKDEITRLNILEERRGSLNEEQKTQRDELVQKYKQTSDEIEKVETDRINRMFKLEVRLAAARIKLLGNTSKAVIDQSTLDTKELNNDISAQTTILIKEQRKILDEEFKLRKAGKSIEADVQLAKAKANQKEIDQLGEVLKAEKSLIESQKQNNLSKLNSATILAGSLSALEKGLSALRAEQTQKIRANDAVALTGIQGRISAQQELIKTAKQLIADLAGVAAAEANIEKLRTALILDETERRTAELNRGALEQIENLVGTDSQKAQQTKLINEQLERDLAELQKARTENAESEAAKREEDTIKRIGEALSRDKAFEEAALSIRLQGIEQRRQAELKAALDGRQDVSLIQDEDKRKKAIEAQLKEIQDIEKKFDAERIAQERATQAVIIQSEIAATQAIIEVRRSLGEPIEEQQAAIEKLKLQLIELGKVDTSSGAKEKTEETKTAIEKFLTETLPLIQGVSDSIFDAVSAGYQRLIQRLDQAVNRSKSALDEIRGDSENFNARQLALEKDRLEKLQQERERAVERERTLGLIQLTTNSLIAISKAAAESGPGAPFAIASTLIALISGFAAARAASSSAFFEGSEFVDKNAKHGHGRDQVPARLNRGERVITTEKNAKYFPVLSAIHNGKIPATALNGFASNYLSGAGHNVSILKEVGKNPILVGMGSDNSRLESRMERIEDAIINLPKYMPGVTVTANGRGIFKTIESRKQGMNTARKIAGR
jgi:DNA repair exonuclease SbcCD ATPase subunit